MTDTYDCIAFDYHLDLIAMWESLQTGEFIPPTEVTEANYLDCIKKVIGLSHNQVKQGINLQVIVLRQPDFLYTRI